jgi:hypothetical protein
VDRDLLIEFAGVVAGHIPVLAVTLTGIAIAIMRRERHPRVSLLAALGLAALTLNYLGGAAVSVYTLVARTSQDPLPLLKWLALMKGGLYVAHVSGIALITWAIFAKRGPLPSVA